ncbi:MAG: R3H domain-containing nucleic acid-binding protein [bacterium]
MDNNTLKDKTEKVLAELASLIKFDATPKIEVVDIEAITTINISLESENLGYMIGYHGKNLESFQTVLQLILNKGLEKPVRVLLNVNNYREKREESLKEIAMEAAEFVRMNSTEKHLAPMRPYDRRIIHLALADQSDLVTDSVGEGEERRVVVKLKSQS